MEKYVKVHMKSKDDFPKTNRMLLCGGSFGLRYLDYHEENSIIPEYSKDYWLKNVDWYLLPEEQSQQENKFQLLMDNISKWSDKTFGEGQRNPAIVYHLKKEVDELIHAIETYQKSDSHGDCGVVYDEYADCFMLIVDSAKHFGMDANFLLQCTEMKLEKNKQRKWGKPDKNGVIEHIKEQSQQANNHIDRYTFVRKHQRYCYECFRTGKEMKYNEGIAPELIELARKEIGYSGKTVNYDIYNSLRNAYKEVKSGYPDVDAENNIYEILKSNKSNPIAYEWHNHKTGHCYMDYIPHKNQDEKDGYTKTPLFQQSQHAVITEEEIFQILSMNSETMVAVPSKTLRACAKDIMEYIKGKQAVIMPIDTEIENRFVFEVKKAIKSKLFLKNDAYEVASMQFNTWLKSQMQVVDLRFELLKLVAFIDRNYSLKLSPDLGKRANDYSKIVDTYLEEKK